MSRQPDSSERDADATDESRPPYSNRGRFGPGAPSALHFVRPSQIVNACAEVRAGEAMGLALQDGAVQIQPWLSAATPLPDGVVARGVLLDLARHAERPWLEAGHAVEPRALDECAEAQGVTLESGDAILVRLGWLGRCVAEAGWDAYRQDGSPGLALSCARWLYDREIALVATDSASVALRSWGDSGKDGSGLQEVAVQETGVVFGANFQLDALAERCAADREYGFLLVAPPPDGMGVMRPVAIR